MRRNFSVVRLGRGHDPGTMRRMGRGAMILAFAVSAWSLACGGAPPPPPMAPDDHAPAETVPVNAAQRKPKPIPIAPAVFLVDPGLSDVKRSELKADGSISCDGKLKASIKGADVVDGDGKVLLTLHDDDHFESTNGVEGTRFDGDVLVVGDKARLSIDDKGVVTATTGGEKTLIGHFETPPKEKRSALFAVQAAMSVMPDVQKMAEDAAKELEANEKEQAAKEQAAAKPAKPAGHKAPTTKASGGKATPNKKKKKSAKPAKEAP